MGCEIVDEIHLTKNFELLTGSCEYEMCNENSGSIKANNF